MNQFQLTGLDGSNPLGFLAALGTLVALDHQTSELETRPRLGWRLAGVWRPVLVSPCGDLSELLDSIERDLADAGQDPVLGFGYQRTKKTQEGKETIDFVRDVKCSPEELRQALLSWVASADATSRRTLDWFTGFVSEGALDNNGAAKPTALHFTSGQQRFLHFVRALAEGVGRGDLEDAIVGPWPYHAELPVMGWDNTETRDHALRATAPADDKKMGNPGADWLALRALEILPSASRRGRQRTPGAMWRSKSTTWAWPIWGPTVQLDVVRALLSARGLRDMAPWKRERMGIEQVFETRILRKGKGYGSVTPAKVL